MHHTQQMIGDPDRGGAWTRAFLGLRARELHVCGGMEGVEVIRQLCQQVSVAITFSSTSRNNSQYMLSCSSGGCSVQHSEQQ
jgi:ATP-dependent RNA helicase SUPV3L1/SUV3